MVMEQSEFSPLIIEIALNCFRYALFVRPTLLYTVNMPVLISWTGQIGGMTNGYRLKPGPGTQCHTSASQRQQESVLKESECVNDFRKMCLSNTLSRKALCFWVLPTDCLAKMKLRIYFYSIPNSLVENCMLQNLLTPNPSLNLAVKH